MNSLWKIVRTVMAVIGGILVYGGVGTSDYYTMELGQAEPASVWPTIWIGLALILPMFIHAICVYLKEQRE